MKAKKFTKETIHDIGMYDRAFPKFEIGDAVAVSQRIVEKTKDGKKERIQIFEGDVIAISNNGAASTFTVRKIGAHSISVERIFPLYTPLIDSIEVLKKGDIRRAKLYYMRDRIGKSARVKEKKEKTAAFRKEESAAKKAAENTAEQKAE